MFLIRFKLHLAFIILCTQDCSDNLNIDSFFSNYNIKTTFYLFSLFTQRQLSIFLQLLYHCVDFVQIASMSKSPLDMLDSTMLGPLLLACYNYFGVQTVLSWVSMDTLLTEYTLLLVLFVSAFIYQMSQKGVFFFELIFLENQ